MHPRNRPGRGHTWWNWVMFQRIAAQYPTSGALHIGNRKAYVAGLRWGWIDKYYGPKELRHAKRYDHWEKIQEILKERAHHAASAKHQRRG